MEKLAKGSRLPLVYRIVFESLRHRWVRTLLSALAIGVGVAMILSVVGMREGLIGDQRARVSSMGAEIWIYPAGVSPISISAAQLSEKLVDFIDQQDYVASATSSTIYPIERINRITGIDYEAFNAMAQFKWLEGRGLEDRLDVIIDDFYSRQNKIGVGDTIEVINQTWNVVGMYESGKSARILVSQDVLQDLTDNIGKVTMLYVKLRDPTQVYEGIAALHEKLSVEQYQIYSVEELLSEFSATSMPEVETFVSVMIWLNVVFGFLVVFLTMHMAVLERTREIGILKSLGASPGYILGIFIREAIALAVFGAIAGILASFGARHAMEVFIPTWQLAIVPGWWPIASLISLGGALLGVLYPAWKAARQDALESLAYE